MLTDAAVYWGTPTSDGYGNIQTVLPVEISVRWVEEQEMIVLPDDKEVMSKSKVYTSIDTENNGYLYHGTLASLGDFKNHNDIEEAYEIIKFQKLPTLRGDQFLRTAWL